VEAGDWELAGEFPTVDELSVAVDPDRGFPALVGFRLGEEVIEEDGGKTMLGGR
jgi:hypothetical protein